MKTFTPVKYMDHSASHMFTKKLRHQIAEFIENHARKKKKDFLQKLQKGRNIVKEQI